MFAKSPIFANRHQAGVELAGKLVSLKHFPVPLVLALPRGGVPVAAPVAEALGAELDVLLVRKLGTPGHPELAMGAIALGGAEVLNEELVRELAIPREAIDAISQNEQRLLEQQAYAYRGTTEPPRVKGRPVIAIDDGMATGATMRVAALALRRLGAARIVVASPVAPASAVQLLEPVSDAVVVAAMPDPFLAVGRWYSDFAQVGDVEVGRLLLQFRPAREAVTSDLNTSPYH
jgi:predicted phosphoribosyltransferase